MPNDDEFAAAIAGFVKGFADEGMNAGKRSSLYIESAGGESPVEDEGLLDRGQH